MNAMKTALRGLMLAMLLLLAPTILLAQGIDEQEPTVRFSKEELTQMLAPIALYPDSLTAQVLMAATYPLEVVEAERWLRPQKDLKGEALDNALKEKKWDPSVKSLCHVPDVLFSMSEKLDQTRKLGDAFLAQEKEVMETIQELRKKAQAQGNLKSSREQTVVVEEEIVRIEPADPEVVYVPVYDPYYVYGPWWYPAYPPYYWYWPPGYVYGPTIYFGPGIYFGFNLFSWAWFDWPYYRVHIDVRHTHRFHRHTHVRGSEPVVWRHNPVHRRGVAYRDRVTSEVYGVRTRQASPTRPELRGYPGRNGGAEAVRSQRSGGQQRERTLERRERQERSVPDRSMERRQRNDGAPSAPERQRLEQPVRRDTPFRGIGEGSFERRAVERGGRSIRSLEPRSYGGSGRSGGLPLQGDGGRGGGNRGGGPRR